MWKILNYLLAKRGEELSKEAIEKATEAINTLGEVWMVTKDNDGNAVVYKNGVGAVYSGDDQSALSYVFNNSQDLDSILILGDYTVSDTLKLLDKNKINIVIYGKLVADPSLTGFMIEIGNTEPGKYVQHNKLYVKEIVGNNNCNGILIHDAYKTQVEFEHIGKVVKGISIQNINSWTEGTKIRGGEIDATYYNIGFENGTNGGHSNVNTTVMDVNMAVYKYGVYIGPDTWVRSSVFMNVDGTIHNDNTHVFHIEGDVGGTVVIAPKGEDINAQYVGETLIYANGTSELWVIQPYAVNLSHIVQNPNGQAVSMLKDYRIFFPAHSPGLFGGITSYNDDFFVGWRLTGNQMRVLNTFEPNRTDDRLWYWQDTASWTTIFALKQDGSVDILGNLKVGGIIGNREGSAILKFLNNAGDNSLYLELFSSDGSSTGSALYITGRYTKPLPLVQVKSDLLEVSGAIKASDVRLPTTAPSSPSNGSTYFDTTNSVLQVYYNNSFFPVPTVVDTTGSLRHLFVTSSTPTAKSVGDIWIKI